MNPLATALGLSPESIEDRLLTMGLSETDRAQLRLSLPAVESNADRFIDGLYQRLLTSPGTVGWFNRPEQLPRLKAQQRSYLIELFSAPLDWEYVERRLQIGVAHHRVRLTPRWYLATCAHFFCDHIDLVLDSSPSLSEGIERLNTLLKTILFDASLVLDAYGMSLENSMRSTQSGPEFDRSEPSSASASATRPGATSPAKSAPLLRMALTSDDCDERLKFLEIDEITRTTLTSLTHTLPRALPGMLDEFYQVFRQWPATQRLLPEVVVQRLLRQVSSYWLELAQARFDRPYAASRTRIGVVHEQIGVSPQIYLVGLARQVTRLLKATALDQPDPRSIIDGLVRAVFFDVSFVIDAYMDARATTVLRSEGYATQLLGCLTVGVAVLDAGLRVQSANPALLKLLRVEAGVIRHLPAVDLIPDARVAPLLERASHHRLHRETIQVNFGGRRLRVCAVRLESAPETPTSPPLALMVDDVTDLAEIAPQLETNDNRLFETIAAVDAVLWETEADTGITAVISQPVLRLTGFREVHFLGRPHALADLIPEPDRQRFTQHCSSLGLNQRCVLLHRLNHADGSIRWVRSHIVRSGESLKTSVFRGVSLDVSSSFQEEKHRLEAVVRLAGSIAHEFNGLLTVVSGSLGLLAEKTASVDPLDVQMVNQAISRGTALTRQLQSFAKGAPLRAEPAILNDVIHSLEATLRDFAGERIEVDVNFQSELWPCQVDKAQFCGTLLNLVTNSRDSMPEGGLLRIRTRNVPASDLLPHIGIDRYVDHVEVAVTDTGVGMETETRTRSIEPFFTTKPEGVGLGLSVAHGFVHQSRGHMLIESSPRQGTTVRLRFPRLEARPPQQSSGTDTPASGRRVLVVEDDALIGGVLRRMLERRGHAARVVPSPEQARLVLQSETPDLVICDVIFAGKAQGSDLGKELAACRPDLPLVYMSGYTKDSLPLGPADRFLAKPFTLEDLDRMLSEIFPAAASSASPTVGLNQPPTH